MRSENNQKYQNETSCQQPFADYIIGGNEEPMVVLYALLTFFIIVANIILLLGLFKTRIKTFTNTNKLFILLAIVNLVTACFLLPYQMYMLKGRQNITCVEVGVRAFFTGFLVTLSGEVITFIAIERYFLIGHKLMHRLYFAPRRMIVYVVALIAASTGWGIGYYFVASNRYPKEASIIFALLATNEGALLLLSLIFNIKILRKVVDARRNSTLSLSNKKTERKLSRTITIISTALVLCYTPSVTTLAIISRQFYKEEKEKIPNTTMTLYWTFMLVFFNCGLNSTIYVLRCKKIMQYICGNGVRSSSSSTIKQKQQKQWHKESNATKPLKKLSIASLRGRQHEKNRKISTASNTLEIKSGTLVPKKPVRTLQRQKNIEEETGSMNLGLER